jgi:hypothetical protein
LVSRATGLRARFTLAPASNANAPEADGLIPLGESGGYHSRGDVLMDRNRKQLTRTTVVAAAVITAGLTVVIAANRVARADLDPQAADYAVMDEDLYGALAVAILGFVVCLVALGIHWVVRGRGAQRRDAPSTIPPLWLPLVVGAYSAMTGMEDSPGWYYAFHFGVGALCLTWVACVLFLVEEASEPDGPVGTGDRME